MTELTDDCTFVWRWCRYGVHEHVGCTCVCCECGVTVCLCCTGVCMHKQSNSESVGKAPLVTFDVSWNTQLVK